MNTHLLILFLSSFTLLTYQQRETIFVNKKFYYFSAKKHPRKKIKRYGKEKIALLLSINTGQKNLLSKEVKEAYKNLTLYHLFTPSGIHLYPLSVILRKICPKWIYFILNLIFFTFLFQFKNFYSIKRILFYKNFQLLSQHRNFSFFLTFLFDYLFGSYKYSPLSFTFSYIFLGSVILSENKRQMISSLYISQIFIAYFFQEPLSLTSPFIGMFLTSLFTPIFFLSFINFWIFYQLDLNLYLSFPLELFNQLVLLLNEHAHFLEIKISFVFFIILLNLKFKKFIFFLLLIFYSQPTNQFFEKSISRSTYKDL